MNTIRNYIIVDDDSIHNTICSMAIKRTLGEANTTTFTVPEEGLEFIKNEYVNTLRPTILFLDINMPTITGWEFMEEFEKFSEEIKKQITVYILSSSIDHLDRDKSKANPYIKGFISKPLLRETILLISKVQEPDRSVS